MDTKLKNNRKKKVILVVAVLLLLSFVNICFFPVIYGKADRSVRENGVEYGEVNEEAIKYLYEGCYLLYLEQKQQEEPAGYQASDLFFTGSRENVSEEAEERLKDILNQWENDFEWCRYQTDYYASDGSVEKKNTEQELEEILSEKPSQEKINALKEYYAYYMVLSFDANGTMRVTVEKNGDMPTDLLIKTFERADREYSLQETFAGYEYDDMAQGDTGLALERIRSFTVVYGIPYTSVENMSLYYNYAEYDVWEETSSMAIWLYLASFVVVALLVFGISRKDAENEQENKVEKPRHYLVEAGCVGIIFCLCLFDGFCEMIVYFAGTVYENSYEFFKYVVCNPGMPECLCGVFLIYLVAFVTFLAVRPLFTNGVRQYIRDYSFCYQVFPWVKKQWKKLTDEIEHMDFSNKTIKTILKLVILNFVVLAVMMCMWMFGIIGLVIYSVILFYLLKKYYDKISHNYQILMQATSRIADGDLDTIITEDIGVFEPFKMELWKIRSGFKKALEEETKSQRMKTELITNVSHDLKTPLTAITTYVELLKKEDITEEERRSYIDTLDKKALRLKVLIEDLFEVSKASSDNIVLHPMDVDVVNLMKQVSIEHTEKYTAAGIELRWNVPDEKVVLSLDNQKTYRIFENLFVNIQKYAMQGSRVYIDVEQDEKQVRITMKNISAVELNVRPEELTERFVRGDASRNTEGSGLGLAIAKSFTEIQNGAFTVAVDGDLFKTVIVWEKGGTEEKKSVPNS